MRIAITGAGGFVGQALIRAARAAGHETVALSRTVARVPGADDTVRVSGLGDRAGLRRAFAGADAVVHLAARVHVMRAEGPAGDLLFGAANVDGTRVVLEEAQVSGVRRFVHLSTAKVHGEGRAAPYRETDALAPVGGYSRSKAESEALVSSVDSARLGWTILRPPLVYGPGVGGNFKRLLQVASLGAHVPLPLGALDNRRSLLAVDNLADLILRCSSSDAAIGRAYLVSDGEDLSTSELVRRLGDALGRPIRLVRFPEALVKAALRMLGRGAEVGRLFGSFTVDSDAVRRELGWHAPLTVDAGLAQVAQWWTSGGRARG